MAGLSFYLDSVPRSSRATRSATLALSSRPPLSEGARIRESFNMLFFLRIPGRMPWLSATAASRRPVWITSYDQVSAINVQGWEDLDDFLRELVSTKNRWMNRGGTTPVQLVFWSAPSSSW